MKKDGKSLEEVTGGKRRKQRKRGIKPETEQEKGPLKKDMFFKAERFFF